MNSKNRHIPRVIESAETPIRPSGRRRFEFSPRQALHYNNHPDAIIEEFERSEYGVVLREIERHVLDWEAQRTPAQVEWVARHRRLNYLSTGAAAKAIVAALRS